VTTDTGAELQRDTAGRLRHFLTLDGLALEDTASLLALGDHDTGIVQPNRPRSSRSSV